MKDDITLRDVLEAVNAGFTAVEQKFADLRTELKTDIASLRADVDNGFTEVNRRIEKVVQPQLDDNVRRIKKLEEEVFPH